MDALVRRARPDEFEAFQAVESAAFGYVPSAEGLAARRLRWDPSRTFTVADGDQLVASSDIAPFQMTVPGGGALGMAGVTSVGVRPTHRRRGLLTAMMRALLDDAREHNEPLAGLYASESIIYGRFGYGLAIEQQWFEIDRNFGTFASAPSTPGAVRMVEAGDARAYAEGVWERAVPLRPGMTARTATQWTYRFGTQGNQAQFFALYEDDGRCDGFVSYSIRNVDRPDGIPAGEVHIVELVAVTDAANAALWRYLLSLDLTQTVKTTYRSARAMDDPLPLMLADPRRLQRRPRDGVWLRVVDAEAALRARRYNVAGQLVIEVQDEFCPWNAGRYEITCEAHSPAEVRVTGASPDLVLPAASLAAIYLGGTKPSALARAGRAEERTPGALLLADAMFGWDIAPWCPEHW